MYKEIINLSLYTKCALEIEWEISRRGKMWREL
jgi:hypothetical protein